MTTHNLLKQLQVDGFDRVSYWYEGEAKVGLLDEPIWARNWMEARVVNQRADDGHGALRRVVFRVEGGWSNIDFVATGPTRG